MIEIQEVHREARSAPQEEFGSKINQTDNIMITKEGFISLALVQLPGISLAIFGIGKALANHKMTILAVKDILRY